MGSPNPKTAVSEATKEAAKLRKAARLIFIPVGKGAPMDRMKTWASKPTSENVFYAKDFKALKHQLTKAVKSSCVDKAKEPQAKKAEDNKAEMKTKAEFKSREKDKKKEKAAKKKEAADKAAKKEKKAKADEKASKEAKKKASEKKAKIKEKETKKAEK